MKKIIAAALASGAFLLSGCGTGGYGTVGPANTSLSNGNPSGSTNPNQKAASTALYQPLAAIMPYPYDAWFGGSTDGTLNIQPPNQARPAQDAVNGLDGFSTTAPIRERFEIQVVPPVWGRQPFLAVSDSGDRNLPRFDGQWGEAGLRLAEHVIGWPAGYYLWCWENPYPERPVERVEFIPHGRRFVVAGLTTSDVDEHPFVRAPARPVRLVAACAF